MKRALTVLMSVFLLAAVIVSSASAAGGYILANAEGRVNPGSPTEGHHLNFRISFDVRGIQGMPEILYVQVRSGPQTEVLAVPVRCGPVREDPDFLRVATCTLKGKSVLPLQAGNGQLLVAWDPDMLWLLWADGDFIHEDFVVTSKGRPK